MSCLSAQVSPRLTRPAFSSVAFSYLVPADKWKDSSYNLRLHINADTVNEVAHLLEAEPTTSLKPFLFLVDPETPSRLTSGPNMTAAEFQALYNEQLARGQQFVDLFLRSFKFIILGGNHGYYGRMELLRRYNGDKAKLKALPNGYWMRGQVVVGAPKELAVKVSLLRVQFRAGHSR
jgi:hypothetical protein